MKRIKHIVEWLCLCAMCLSLSGCGETEWLERVPKDFAVLSETSEPSASTVEESQEKPEAESSETSKTQKEAEPERNIFFLWNGADDYAYSSLNGAEQLWYRDMEYILGNFQEEAMLSAEGLSQGLNDSNIDKVFQCVLNDHPELFFVSGYSYTTFSENDKLTSISFSGSYNVDRATAEAKLLQIQAAAEPLLAGISQGASDYDKVKYVYENIIRNTDYNLASSDNQNIYSVFVNHSSVCQGYAKAAQYLLNRLGVECTLVLGTVESGEGHAWNLVKVDGSYYYVDTTWGDASYQQSEDVTVQLAMPEINYDYMNVTSAELLRTHSIGGCVPMPECVAMEANYYVREGALFGHYDRNQMSALFTTALAQGRDDVTVKCVDAQCYSEILTALIEQQEIFDYLSSAGESIAYAQNDTQLSLTFWVTK